MIHRNEVIFPSRRFSMTAASLFVACISFLFSSPTPAIQPAAGLALRGGPLSCCPCCRENGGNSEALNLNANGVDPLINAGQDKSEGDTGANVSNETAVNNSAVPVLVQKVKKEPPKKTAPWRSLAPGNARGKDVVDYLETEFLDNDRQRLLDLHAFLSPESKRCFFMGRPGGDFWSIYPENGEEPATVTAAAKTGIFCGLDAGRGIKLSGVRTNFDVAGSGLNEAYAKWFRKHIYLNGTTEDRDRNPFLRSAIPNLHVSLFDDPAKSGPVTVSDYFEYAACDKTNSNANGDGCVFLDVVKGSCIGSTGQTSPVAMMYVAGWSDNMVPSVGEFLDRNMDVAERAGKLIVEYNKGKTPQQKITRYRVYLFGGDIFCSNSYAADKLALHVMEGTRRGVAADSDVVVEFAFGTSPKWNYKAKRYTNYKDVCLFTLGAQALKQVLSKPPKIQDANR